MAVYMIGYDLHEGEDYQDLEDAIDALGNWWHCLDSTWLLVHAGDAVVIRDALVPHLVRPDEEGGDRLLVSRLYPDMAWTGAFSEDCKQWLLDHGND